MKAIKAVLYLLVVTVVSVSCGSTEFEVSGANLVKNGDFENNLDDWNVQAANAEMFTVSTLLKVSGAKSLRVRDCEWQGVVSQIIQVEPGTNYLLTVSCIVSRDEDAPYGVLIKVVDALPETLKFFEINAGGIGWKSYRESFYSGDKTSVTITINGNKSEFYADGISLYKIIK